MKSIFTIVFVFGFAISVSAQARPFPNELDGYRFFGDGRLKNVVFGVTTKVEIEKLFGSSCERKCEYDSRFWVTFDYLSCEDCMTTRHIRDRAMCPFPEFIGTIEKITLTPRVPVQFDKISTSPFKIHTGGGTTSKDGSGSVYWGSFGDEFGLKYSIRQGTSSLTLTTPAPSLMSGPLYSIEYGISEELETNIFKAEYKSCVKRADS